MNIKQIHLCKKISANHCKSESLSSEQLHLLKQHQHMQRAESIYCIIELCLVILFTLTTIAMFYLMYYNGVSLVFSDDHINDLWTTTLNLWIGIFFIGLIITIAGCIHIDNLECNYKWLLKTYHRNEIKNTACASKNKCQIKLHKNSQQSQKKDDKSNSLVSVQLQLLEKQKHLHNAESKYHCIQLCAIITFTIISAAILFLMQYNNNLVYPDSIISDLVNNAIHIWIGFVAIWFIATFFIGETHMCNLKNDYQQELIDYRCKKLLKNKELEHYE